MSFCSLFKCSASTTNTLQWLGGAQPQLRRAAAQCLGLLAEAEGATRFVRRLSDPALLGLLLGCLHGQAHAVDGAEGEAEGGGVVQRGLHGGWTVIVIHLSSPQNGVEKLHAA